MLVLTPNQCQRVIGGLQFSSEMQYIAEYTVIGAFAGMFLSVPGGGALLGVGYSSVLLLAAKAESLLFERPYFVQGPIQYLYQTCPE